jgi:hypothetical protein
MVAIPSIVILFLLAAQAFGCSLILRRPWHKRIAVGCGIFEISIAIGLSVLTATYSPS